jgi:uncharacterized membrane protein
MIKLKKISLIILILFYLIAGVNHFRNPASYIKIIPPHFLYPRILNLLAGFFEISFAVMLIFIKTRPQAAWGVILMLLAFLPVHIKMVADAPFLLGNITVTPLIAWIRLIILQPLLILWAYWYTPTKKND